jgi:hypothetical protein
LTAKQISDGILCIQIPFASPFDIAEKMVLEKIWLLISQKSIFCYESTHHCKAYSSIIERAIKKE